MLLLLLLQCLLVNYLLHYGGAVSPIDTPYQLLLHGRRLLECACIRIGGGMPPMSVLSLLFAAAPDGSGVGMPPMSVLSPVRRLLSAYT
jgi:hypothetical protein